MSEGEERRKGADKVSADGFCFWLRIGVATNNKTCKTALKNKYETQFFFFGQDCLFYRLSTEFKATTEECGVSGSSYSSGYNQGLRTLADTKLGSVLRLTRVEYLLS